MMLLLLAVCAGVALVLAHPADSPVNNRYNAAGLLVILTILSIISTALAEITVYDRRIYVSEMTAVSGLSLPDALAAVDREPLFLVLVWLVGRVSGASEVSLFATVGTLCAVGYLAALRMLLPPCHALAGWLTLLASGLFFAYANIAARQGLAMAALAVVVALSATGSRRHGLYVVLLSAACLLHWSALPLAISLAVLRMLGSRLVAVWVVWGGLVGAYLLGAQERLLQRFGGSLTAVEEFASDELFLSYTLGVNRLDFLLVSAVLAVAAALGMRIVGEDEVYRRIVATYLLFNSYFLAFGFAAFSDRAAAYSWSLGPLLLWYPASRLQGAHAGLLRGGAVLVVVVLGFRVDGLDQLVLSAPLPAGHAELHNVA